MLRRSILVISFLLLLSGITAAQNRPYGWTAWLRYGQHMTLINAAGESLREVDLPVPAGFAMSDDSKIAVSPSGRLAAYLLRGEDNAAQVMVFDTESAALLVQYPLDVDGAIWDTSWFLANEHMFSAAETQLAFGYAIFHETTHTGDWALLVLDLASGKPVYQLHHDDFMSDIYIWTPLIRRWQGAEITFTLDLLGTDGNPNSYIWNMLTGKVRPTTAFPNLHSAFFAPTGEVVTQMFNSAPLAIPESSPSKTTLEVYDPLMGGRYPFFQTTIDLPFIERMEFVQNGSLLLLKSYDSWMLMGRDGVVLDRADLNMDTPVSSIKGVPEGFIYATRQKPVNQTGLVALIMVDTGSGKLDFGQMLWRLSSDDYWNRTGGQDVPLEIAWVHTDAPLSTFTPWTQLSPALYEPAVDREYTHFVMEQTAFVTTNRLPLQVSNFPWLSGQSSVELHNTEQVTVIQGPASADGLLWWKIRTADGIEGWVVESITVDSSGTRLKTLTPG